MLGYPTGLLYAKIFAGKHGYLQAETASEIKQCL
jgi:hypothetical protein